MVQLDGQATFADQLIQLLLPEHEDDVADVYRFKPTVGNIGLMSSKTIPHTRTAGKPAMVYELCRSERWMKWRCQGSGNA